MHFISSYQLQRDRCSRLPSWRWSWAQRIVGDGRPWPADIDDAGLSALRLAQHAQVEEGGGACFDVDGQVADELAALAIHRGDPARRTLVEAWLLSGQSDVEVGHRLDLERAVVGAYEMLFYSVRDRLEARDWIIVCAVGWPIHPDGHRDIASAIKLLAYLGGPLLLDIVLVATGMATALSPGHPMRAVDERLAIRTRLLVDVLTHPPRCIMAFRLWEQLRDIQEKRPQATASSGRQMQAEVDSVLDDLEWTTLDVSECPIADEGETVGRHPATA